MTVFHIEVVTTGKDGDRELVRVRFGDSASRSLHLSDFRVFQIIKGKEKDECLGKNQTLCC